VAGPLLPRFNGCDIPLESDMLSDVFMNIAIIAERRKN
jgi:hypothetical protein